MSAAPEPSHISHLRRQIRMSDHYVVRTLARGRFILLALALFLVHRSEAAVVPTGKIQGKIAATDSGEPIGFADVVLIPADTTLHKVGGLTNADGTFLLEAPAGHYELRIRALSYTAKRF